MATKNKYAKKVKLNKSAIITLVVSLLVVVGVILFVCLSDAKDSIAKDYGLDKEHVFKEVKYKNFESTIGTSDFVYVFLADPSDSTSITNASVVDDCADTFNITLIYYLNKAKMSDDELSEFKNKYSTSTIEISIKYVPQVLVFKDGVLVDSSDRYVNNDVENMSYEQACTRLFTLK